MKRLTGYAAALATVGALAVGVVAQVLPSEQLASRTAAAKTKDDHRKLAAHYRAHAAEHEADAKVHRAIVAEAKTRPDSGHAWELAQGAAHYAEHSAEAAEALRDLAALHEGMAEEAPATAR